MSLSGIIDNPFFDRVLVPAGTKYAIIAEVIGAVVAAILLALAFSQLFGALGSTSFIAMTTSGGALSLITLLGIVLTAVAYSLKKNRVQTSSDHGDTLEFQAPENGAIEENNNSPATHHLELHMPILGAMAGHDTKTFESWVYISQTEDGSNYIPPKNIKVTFEYTPETTVDDWLKMFECAYLSEMDLSCALINVSSSGVERLPDLLNRRIFDQPFALSEHIIAKIFTLNSSAIDLLGTQLKTHLPIKPFENCSAKEAISYMKATLLEILKSASQSKMEEINKEKLVYYEAQLRDLKNRLNSSPEYNAIANFSSKLWKMADVALQMYTASYYAKICEDSRVKLLQEFKKLPPLSKREGPELLFTSEEGSRTLKVSTKWLLSASKYFANQLSGNWKEHPETEGIEIQEASSLFLDYLEGKNISFETIDFQQAADLLEDAEFYDCPHLSLGCQIQLVKLIQNGHLKEVPKERCKEILELVPQLNAIKHLIEAFELYDDAECLSKLDAAIEAASVESAKTCFKTLKKLKEKPGMYTRVTHSRNSFCREYCDHFFKAVK